MKKTSFISHIVSFPPNPNSKNPKKKKHGYYEVSRYDSLIRIHICIQGISFDVL